VWYVVHHPAPTSRARWAVQSSTDPPRSAQHEGYSPNTRAVRTGDNLRDLAASAMADDRNSVPPPVFPAAFAAPIALSSLMPITNAFSRERLMGIAHFALTHAIATFARSLLTLGDGDQGIQQGPLTDCTAGTPALNSVAFPFSPLRCFAVSRPARSE
jgi:hypothetical protein